MDKTLDRYKSYHNCFDVFWKTTFNYTIIDQNVPGWKKFLQGGNNIYSQNYFIKTLNKGTRYVLTFNVKFPKCKAIWVTNKLVNIGKIIQVNKNGWKKQLCRKKNQSISIDDLKINTNKQQKRFKFKVVQKNCLKMYKVLKSLLKNKKKIERKRTCWWTLKI